MKKLFLLFVMMIASFAVSAQSVYLPELTRGQTGSYQVIVESESAVRSSTGMFIQVFDAGERLLNDGTRLDSKFAFGALFFQDGSFAILSTAFERGENPLTLDVTQGNAKLGQVVFEVDKPSTGDTQKIYATFVLDTVIPLSEARQFKATFLRISDRRLSECRNDVDFSPVNPDNVEPCEVP